MRLLLMLIFLGCISGCGQGTEATPAGHGKISFKVLWEQNTTNKRVGLGSMPADVMTVRAMISGPFMTTMQRDFPAAAHQGSLDAVPAGSNRTLTLQGLDSEGQAIFSASVSGISVAADAITDAGTVVMRRLTKPMANAGLDQIVVVGSTVVLNGSASSDADGDVLSYSWQFIEKPLNSTASITNATAVMPTFIADMSGNYIVILTITDSSGSISTPGTVTIKAATSAGPLLVDGYMDKLSYNPGESAALYVNAGNTDKTVLSLYNLLGVKVDSMLVDLKPQTITTQSPWEEGYGYLPTATYTIPNLKSGMYFWENKIPFIIKEPTKKADIVVLYPTNTQNAYNSAGGKSMYSEESAVSASFLRPFSNFSHGYAINYMKWIFENTSNSISYVSDRDFDDYYEIANAKLIILTGHSEYWTRKARENFDRFVDSGGNVLILSGNTMWWQVRYSEDGSKMICYKNAVPDPFVNPLLRTINWIEPSLAYPVIPSIGAVFTDGGYGRSYPDRGWNGFKIVTASPSVFSGTGMVRGDVLAMPSMEYDGTNLSGFDSEGYPIIDKQKLGFYNAEILGFDYGTRGGKETVGTWIAFQKTATSGIIINGASTDWCSSYGIGGTDSVRIKQIISNMTNALLNNTYRFQQ